MAVTPLSRALALSAWLSALALPLVVGCGPPEGGGGVILLDDGDEGIGHRGNRPARKPPDAGPDAGRPDDDAGPTPPFDSFIGGPCATAADCGYDDAVCVTGGGFTGGTCTQACDLLCPDREGEPITFCVADGELPDDARGLGDGACLSRCDFGAYPDGGCRDGYACVERHRANQPETTQLVCLPEGDAPPLPDCLQELAALDVAFTPVTMPDEQAAGASEPCHVEDPVLLHPPIHGVDLAYYDGTPTPNVRMSCEGAKALVQTVDDVAADGVVEIRHIGTYNCRVIAGTSTLSRHAFGDAIDLYGFTFDDGSVYTLVDDWEHDTTSFASEGGEWLYTAAHRWYDAYIWNIILTPNYNAAHDNHFHVDLSPASHYIGWFDGRYIGPAPYVD